MAGSYNRITLIGNLTRDPEIRYVDGTGKAVTKFTLAVNRKSKSGDETLFVDIIAWERLAEICNEYLKKGMSTLVEGRLVIRKYDDKNGNKRTAVEVVASEMQMLDKKDGAAAAARELVAAGSGGRSRAAASTDDDFEDDPFNEIPF